MRGCTHTKFLHSKQNSKDCESPKTESQNDRQDNLNGQSNSEGHDHSHDDGKAISRQAEQLNMKGFDRNINNIINFHHFSRFLSLKMVIFREFSKRHIPSCSR